MKSLPRLHAWKGEACIHCNKVTEGHFAIHRDGFGEGPEVPLCNACGSGPTPTCEEIWARIRIKKVRLRFLLNQAVRAKA